MSREDRRGGRRILCGGTIRSGSALQHQSASELIERAGFGGRPGCIDATEQARLPGRRPPITRAAELRADRIAAIEEVAVDWIRKDGCAVSAAGSADG